MSAIELWKAGIPLMKWKWKKVMLSDESHSELRFGKQSFCCRRARGTVITVSRFLVCLVAIFPQPA